MGGTTVHEATKTSTKTRKIQGHNFTKDPFGTLKDLKPTFIRSPGVPRRTRGFTSWAGALWRSSSFTAKRWKKEDELKRELIEKICVLLFMICNFLLQCIYR